MSLYTFNNFSHSSCTFSHPEKDDNIYNSALLNNGTPVYIQLPPLKTPNGIQWHDDRCYLDLELTKPVLDFFLDFEKKNIQATYENSSKWFGKEMPIDIIESNYISVVRLNSNKSYVRFSIPTRVNKNKYQCNINVYNQFREKANPDEIIPGSDVWVILRCKGLAVGKRNLCFEWHVEQVKFHTKQGNPYMFIDEAEEEEEEAVTPSIEEKQFEDYLQG